MATNNNANSILGEETDDHFLEQTSKDLRIFAGVVTIVIIIVGLLGNTLTVAALIKCPKIRNINVAFIISLCLAGIFYCILFLPWSVYRFFHGRMAYGKDSVMCRINPLVQYANVGVSLLSIAMITINRFIMIAYPHVYSKVYTLRNVAAMVAFIWIFSFAILIPILAGKWGRFGYEGRLGGCSIIDSRSAKVSLFLIGFLVPCLTICFCYAGIFWIFYSSRSRVQSHASSNVGRSGNDWRLTKMILAIFLSFLICYLPTTIIKVIDKETTVDSNWHIVSYILIYLSACLNPIIYAACNKQYRQAYKSVLFAWKPDGFNLNTSASDKTQRAVNRATGMTSASVCLSPSTDQNPPALDQVRTTQTNNIPLASLG